MNFTIAALIAGITAGLLIGYMAAMASAGRELEALKDQLSRSIPKVKVIQAINGSHLNARQKRKDGSNRYWEGALQAVWHDLQEDLK